MLVSSKVIILSVRYLGLDQALKTSGWAVFENDSIIAHGSFTIAASLPIEQRLGQFWKELNGLYSQYEFEHVFYEDIQRQQNVETYKKLAYVQAATLMWCYFKDISCSSLGPSHWRNLIKEKFKISFGRSRSEQKKAAQDFVKSYFNIEASEDECDAICLTLAGIQEKRYTASAF